MVLQPDSSALATPADLGLPTGTDTLSVRRLDQVSVTSIDDDEGMTWQSYGKLVMREYAKVYLRAKDLPHTVQDYMNSIPPFMRRVPGLERTVFKAVIRSNTAESEPQAPEIDIVNQVDDEACPPFEFYYSNQMWHSDSVPPPDASKLEGCDCFPYCVPDAKKCSCYKRQKQYYDASMSGFNYDKKGRLRYEEYPVFECNILCGCDDTCRNRVSYHNHK
jgi:[histone H3]-lysine9 N-trimethyltransferase SUV39H